PPGSYTLDIFIIVVLYLMPWRQGPGAPGRIARGRAARAMPCDGCSLIPAGCLKYNNALGIYKISAPPGGFRTAGRASGASGVAGESNRGQGPLRMSEHGFS